MFAAYVQADAIVKDGASRLKHVAFVAHTNFQLVLCCIVDAVEMLLHSATHRRGIILYLEYHNVCTFVRIGSPPPPLPPAPLPPPEPKEGQHSLVDQGGEGSQFGQLERKPGTLYTLCYTFYSS